MTTSKKTPTAKAQTKEQKLAAIKALRSTPPVVSTGMVHAAPTKKELTAKAAPASTAAPAKASVKAAVTAKAAPSAAEKAPAAPKASPPAGPAPHTKYNGMSKAEKDALRVKLLVSENPKKAGSATHDRFELYKNGVLVGELKAKGVTGEDLRWDIDHNFITLQ